jgi:hypothetical protein
MAAEQDKEQDSKPEEAEEKKKIAVYRTPLFTKLYATNLRVSPTDVDIRIEFFNEKVKTEEGIVFYSDGVAMLTPEAAKKLYLELKNAIEKYETEKGEIQIKGERQDCEFNDE